MATDEIEASTQALRQLVSDAYYPVSLRTTGGEASVRVSYTSRGGGWFKTTRGRVNHTAPIHGARAWADIHRDGRDDYMLVAPRSGEIVHRQFGRSSRIGPGQMVLVSAGAPYEFERLSAGEITAHHLPGALVREIIPQADDLCVVAFASSRGIGDAVRSLCASAWREIEHLEDGERYLLVGTIVALIAAACRGPRGKRPRRSRSPNTLPPYARAIEYIEGAIDDPQLDRTKIAEAIGVSISHLHALMNRHGTTTGKVILATRLNRCARDLRSPSNRDVRVSDIAFRWGFNDAAHFSRSFRAQFGTSPSDYRTRMH